MIGLTLAVLLLSETVFETTTMSEKLIDNVEVVRELIRSDHKNGQSIRELEKKWGLSRSKIHRIVRQKPGTGATIETEKKKGALEGVLVQHTQALIEKRTERNIEIHEVASNKKKLQQESDEKDFDGLKSSLSEDLRKVDLLGRRLAGVADKAFEDFQRWDETSQGKPELKADLVAISLAAQKACETSAKLKMEAVKSRIAPIETKDDRNVTVEIQRREKKDAS